MKYDCIIIGSGPAGFYSALSCAKKGYRTALIERDKTGGTGFRTGCLPVKRNLDVLRKVEEAIAVSGEKLKQLPGFRENLLQNTEKYMAGVESMISNRLKEAGVHIYLGNGEFLDAHTYLLKDRRLETDIFIVATGGSPGSLPGIKLDGKNIISHIEALKLKKLPGSIVIIGGNVEGIELAVMFSSLGVRVKVVEQLSLILDGTDRDLIEPVIAELEAKGVSFLTSVKAESAVKKGKHLIVLLNNGNRLCTDKVILTGIRNMNIPVGIERTGINYSNTGIPVNESLMSNIPNIFAVGDINGVSGMAHVAIQQGMLISEGLEGRSVIRDYKSLPRAMFTIPEIAGAGVQEGDLIKKNTPYGVRKYPLKESWRGFSRGVKTGFIKLIFENSVLSGIWMTGPDASEILSCSGLLIGQNLSEIMIRDNLFIHPSLGEGILEALFMA